MERLRTVASAEALTEIEAVEDLADPDVWAAAIRADHPVREELIASFKSRAEA